MLKAFLPYDPSSISFLEIATLKVLSLESMLKSLADVVFPPQCMSCGDVLCDRSFPLCPLCFSQINFIRSPLCPSCGCPHAEPAEKDHLCGDCLLAPPAFLTARALGQYESVLMDIIHRFKYGGKVSLGERLGELMAQFTYSSFIIRDYSLVIPVPLHPRRLRQRGFNQALILAREIARCYSLGLDITSLKRIVCTEPQVGLGRDRRTMNIKGAFSVTDQGRIKGERIILVDDVYTTGSTAKECARILMKNKAEKVAVLTLARAF